MAMTDPDLWLRIYNYDLPHRDEWDADAEPGRWCQTLADNLRKGGDWTDESATRLVKEYRRFLYLKALSKGRMTPPKVIDEVWHLHLDMGDDFENRFCTAIGSKLTHEPKMERDAAMASYERGYYA